MRLRAIVVLMSMVVALGWAVPAFATTYGTSASPIKAETNSSDGNAWFFGAVIVKDQTWLRNRYYFRDSAPGGNTAYVTTDWYFWKGCVDGKDCFDYSSQDRSTDNKSGEWILELDYEDLDPVSDRGRAMTRVCENQNNSPDACSKYVYVTLSY